MTHLLSLAIGASLLAPTSRPIPAFTAQATDGKTYTAATLVKKDTVLVFIQGHCPHNKKAMPDWNKFATALKSHTRILGVLGAGLKEAKEFASQHKTVFPILADKDFKMIEGFAAKQSLDNAVVLSRTKAWEKSWSGYSADSLSEILQTLGTKTKVDLSSFPEKTQSGCSL